MLLFQQVFITKSGSKSKYVFEVYTDECNEICYHSYKLSGGDDYTSGSTYESMEEMLEELKDFYLRQDDFDVVFPFTYKTEVIAIMEEPVKKAGEKDNE